MHIFAIEGSFVASKRSLGSVWGRLLADPGVHFRSYLNKFEQKIVFDHALNYPHPACREGSSVQAFKSQNVQVSKRSSVQASKRSSAQAFKRSSVQAFYECSVPTLQYGKSSEHVPQQEIRALHKGTATMSKKQLEACTDCMPLSVTCEAQGGRWTGVSPLNIYIYIYKYIYIYIEMCVLESSRALRARLILS